MITADLLKRPSAFIPIALSLGALLIVGVHVAVYGTAREADEGTAAHLWQLLMAAQIPIMGYFLFTSLPKSPRETWPVFALQIAAAPVYFLHL